MASYFPLSEHFRTQNEPAYCGLTSLTIILNALGVDPGRVWKGPWRWFHEDMLNCCTPLDTVKEHGVTVAELASLARCNGATARSYRHDETTEDQFRAAVRTMSRQESGPFLLAAYSRSCLGQTGSGHFSPVAGYHAKSDMALVLDTATFKYPPHWLPVSALFNAMAKVDPRSDRCRGWLLLDKSPVKPPLYFMLDNSGRADDWVLLTNALEERLSRPAASEADLVEAVMQIVQESDLLPDLSNYVERFRIYEVAEGHRRQVDEMLAQLRATPTFAAVQAAVRRSPQFASLATKLDVFTMLLFALPPRVWHRAADCAHCGAFPTLPLPEPLRSEILAVRGQIQAVALVVPDRLSPLASVPACDRHAHL